MPPAGSDAGVRPPAGAVIVDAGNGLGVRLAAARLSSGPVAPAGHQAVARALLWQVQLLWQRRVIDYILLRAVRP